MRTAQIIRRLSFDDWGGTETTVWQTAIRLRQIGDDPQILATTALCPIHRETRQELAIRRFPYLYPNFPMGRKRRDRLDRKGGNPYVLRLRKVLTTEPFDIIHCHNLGRILGLASRAAKARKIPCVLTLHGGATQVPPAELAHLAEPTRHTLPWGAILDRLLNLRPPELGALDGVVCVGRDEFDALRERHPNLPLLHLPNGVDTERFARSEGVDANPVRRRLGIEPGIPMVLCAARLDPQKNQEILLRFAARCRSEGAPVALVLAGAVSDQAYESHLRVLAEKLFLSGLVVFAGAFAPNSKELVDLYHAADVFILPSRHEPFGIVALEAWAAGVPLIASRAGGLGRLVRDGVDALAFDSDDLEGLCGAWKRLRSVPGLRERLVAEGGCSARRFGWDRVAATLRDFYLRLIAQRGSD